MSNKSGIRRCSIVPTFMYYLICTTLPKAEGEVPAFGETSVNEHFWVIFRVYKHNDMESKVLRFTNTKYMNDGGKHTKSKQNMG